MNNCLANIRFTEIIIKLGFFSSASFLEHKTRNLFMRKMNKASIKKLASSLSRNKFRNYKNWREIKEIEDELQKNLICEAKNSQPNRNQNTIKNIVKKCKMLSNVNQTEIKTLRL